MYVRASKTRGDGTDIGRVPLSRRVKRHIELLHLVRPSTRLQKDIDTTSAQYNERKVGVVSSSLPTSS